MNAIALKTRGAKTAAVKLNRYFRDACKLKQARKKGAKSVFMFYLSGTGSIPGFGPICLATGVGCEENEKKDKQILGLNNMMMNKLNREDGYGEQGFGLVMMDFPGPLLVKKFIEINPDASN